MNKEIENIGYSKQDIEATHNLFIYANNLEIQKKIDKIYKQIDSCDDIQMREYLVKKISKLKTQLKSNKERVR